MKAVTAEQLQELEGMLATAGLSRTLAGLGTLLQLQAEEHGSETLKGAYLANAARTLFDTAGTRAVMNVSPLEA